MLPLRLFRSRERVGAYAGRLLFFGAILGLGFFLTQFFQDVRGYSPLQAGLAFLPMTLPNFALAFAVPRLTRTLGNGRLLAGGLVLALVGLAWLSRLSADTPYLTGVALPLVLFGLGQGASLAPLTGAGIAGVAPEDAGAASGLVNVAQQLGGSLGLGILVAVFAAAGSRTLRGETLLAHRMATALTVGTAFLALAVGVVVVLIVAAKPTAVPTDDPATSPSPVQPQEAQASRPERTAA